MRALDLFAGPGGWDVAAERLGIETDGVELDPAAQLTRAAAGHKTIHDDVTTFDIPLPGEYDGLIASPPCQSFSAAGKRKGLEDPRGQLVFQVMRYVWAIGPRWIACEQVPAVLSIWQQFAGELSERGYSTWTGNLHAEQYGVPQTRKRAILLASLDRKVAPPQATHSKYHSRSPEKLDEGVLKWASMAEALEPKATHMVAAGVTGEGRPRGADHPAPTLTGKGTAYWLPEWAYRRPSYTVTGGGSSTGGAEPFGNGARQQMAKQGGVVKVTHQEAAILQSFPVDYPWQGTKGQQFQQVGNAIPPLLAEAVLRVVAA